MASTLTRAWIVSSIVSRIDDAVEQRRTFDPNVPIDTRYQYLLQLYGHVTAKSCRAQIIEFITVTRSEQTTGSITLNISDGSNYIKCTMTRSCAEKLERVSHTGYLESLRGGIIKVLEYQLCFYAEGNRIMCVYLELQDCEFVGSDGLSVIGNPSFVTEDRQFSLCMEKAKELIYNWNDIPSQDNLDSLLEDDTNIRPLSRNSRDENLIQEGWGTLKELRPIDGLIPEDQWHVLMNIQPAFIGTSSRRSVSHSRNSSNSPTKLNTNSSPSSNPFIQKPKKVEFVSSLNLFNTWDDETSSESELGREDQETLPQDTTDLPMAPSDDHRLDPIPESSHVFSNIPDDSNRTTSILIPQLEVDAFTQAVVNTQEMSDKIPNQNDLDLNKSSESTPKSQTGDNNYDTASVNADNSLTQFPQTQAYSLSLGTQEDNDSTHQTTDLHCTLPPTMTQAPDVNESYLTVSFTQETVIHDSFLDILTQANIEESLNDDESLPDSCREAEDDAIKFDNNGMGQSSRETVELDRQSSQHTNSLLPPLEEACAFPNILPADDQACSSNDDDDACEHDLFPASTPLEPKTPCLLDNPREQFNFMPQTQAPFEWLTQTIFDTEGPTVIENSDAEMDGDDKGFVEPTLCSPIASTTANFAIQEEDGDHENDQQDFDDSIMEEYLHPIDTYGVDNNNNTHSTSQDSSSSKTRLADQVEHPNELELDRFVNRPSLDQNLQDSAGINNINDGGNEQIVLSESREVDEIVHLSPTGSGSGQRDVIMDVDKFIEDEQIVEEERDICKQHVTDASVEGSSSALVDIDDQSLGAHGELEKTKLFPKDSNDYDILQSFDNEESNMENTMTGQKEAHGPMKTRHSIATSQFLPPSLSLSRNENDKSFEKQQARSEPPAKSLLERMWNFASMIQGSVAAAQTIRVKHRESLSSLTETPKQDSIDQVLMQDQQTELEYPSSPEIVTSDDEMFPELSIIRKPFTLPQQADSDHRNPQTHPKQTSLETLDQEVHMMGTFQESTDNEREIQNETETAIEAEDESAQMNIDIDQPRVHYQQATGSDESPSKNIHDDRQEGQTPFQNDTSVLLSVHQAPSSNALTQESPEDVDNASLSGMHNAIESIPQGQSADETSPTGSFSQGSRVPLSRHSSPVFEPGKVSLSDVEQIVVDRIKEMNTLSGQSIILSGRGSNNEDLDARIKLEKMQEEADEELAAMLSPAMDNDASQMNIGELIVTQEPVWSPNRLRSDLFQTQEKVKPFEDEMEKWAETELRDANFPANLLSSPAASGKSLTENPPPVEYENFMFEFDDHDYNDEDQKENLAAHEAVPQRPVKTQSNSARDDDDHIHIIPRNPRQTSLEDLNKADVRKNHSKNGQDEHLEYSTYTSETSVTHREPQPGSSIPNHAASRVFSANRKDGAEVERIQYTRSFSDRKPSERHVFTATASQASSRRKSLADLIKADIRKNHRSNMTQNQRVTNGHHSRESISVVNITASHLSSSKRSVIEKNRIHFARPVIVSSMNGQPDTRDRQQNRDMSRISSTEGPRRKSLADLIKADIRKKRSKIAQNQPTDTRVSAHVPGVLQREPLSISRGLLSNRKAVQVEKIKYARPVIDEQDVNTETYQSRTYDYEQHLEDTPSKSTDNSSELRRNYVLGKRSRMYEDVSFVNSQDALKRMRRSTTSSLQLGSSNHDWTMAHNNNRQPSSDKKQKRRIPWNVEKL